MIYVPENVEITYNVATGLPDSSVNHHLMQLEHRPIDTVDECILSWARPQRKQTDVAIALSAK